MTMKYTSLFLALLLIAPALSAADSGAVAAKPLYRDPVYDGAADPTLIWNPLVKHWWMFYTNRRANVPGLSGVTWVHGTPIGIAESADGGANWKYVGAGRDARAGRNVADVSHRRAGHFRGLESSARHRATHQHKPFEMDESKETDAGLGSCD